jgi:hypothetical protein
MRTGLFERLRANRYFFDYKGKSLEFPSLSWKTSATSWQKRSFFLIRRNNTRGVNYRGGVLEAELGRLYLFPNPKAHGRHILIGRILFPPKGTHPLCRSQYF